MIVFDTVLFDADKLETSVWEVGSRADGTTELTFVTKNLSSGKVRAAIASLSIGADTTRLLQLALGAGIAYVNKREKSKL